MSVIGLHKPPSARTHTANRIESTQLTNNCVWYSAPDPSWVSSPTLKVRSTAMSAAIWTPVDLDRSPQTPFPAVLDTALRLAVSCGSFIFSAASYAGRPITSIVSASTGCENTVTLDLTAALSLKGICWMVGSQLWNCEFLGLMRSALMMALLLICYMSVSAPRGRGRGRGGLCTFARTP